MRSGPVVALVCWFALCACSRDGAQIGPLAIVDQADTPRTAAASREATTAAPRLHTPQRDASAPVRVHYAFAQHREAAELRRGTTQLFDFGEPGDAKYTFGGWLGAESETRAVEGRHAMQVRGKSLRMGLPADRADQRALALELRANAAATLTLVVNGKRVADRKLQGKRFENVVIELPPGALRAGENAVEVRVADGKGQGFLLDSIALLSNPADVANAKPPGHEEFAVKGAAQQLRVPKGLRMSYAFEVPANAVFQAQVSSPGKAQFSVRAVRDRGAEQVLAALDVDATAKAVNIDLDARNHEVVRLDLVAEGDAVVLDRPAVVTPVDTKLLRPAKPVRNVLIYLIDTLRADKLSPYNPQSRVRTPGLTRFLENAAVLAHARTQENWTKPSVATLLSSLFPWQHNTFNDNSVLPESVEILPEVLQKRGFFTGAFIANGYVSDKFGFKQGWETYRNYIREGRKSVAQSVAADVLEWLDARPKNKPFFLYVHTIDPHVPCKPPPDFLALYDALPYDGIVSFRHDAELLEKIKLGRIKLDDRDKVRLQALYDGEITYHDVHFEAIMHALDKRGLSEDTLVVITADHGEEFWDHGSVGHGHSVYDELLHIPMMVRLPGVTRASTRIGADVGLVDVGPTVLDALGLPAAPTMSGRSFLPELLGDGADAPRVSTSGFMTGWRTLAAGSWKLVQRAQEKAFLYDTAKDPGETHDLADERPITLRYLRGQLGLMLANSSEIRSARTHAGQKTSIDAATEQQLRALGYVGSARR